MESIEKYIYIFLIQKVKSESTTLELSAILPWINSNNNGQPQNFLISRLQKSPDSIEFHVHLQVYKAIQVPGHRHLWEGNEGCCDHFDFAYGWRDNLGRKYIDMKFCANHVYLLSRQAIFYVLSFSMYFYPQPQHLAQVRFIRLRRKASISFLHHVRRQIAISSVHT